MQCKEILHFCKVIPENVKKITIKLNKKRAWKENFPGLEFYEE